MFFPALTFGLDHDAPVERMVDRVETVCRQHDIEPSDPDDRGDQRGRAALGVPLFQRASVAIAGLQH
jgi:hypothetical protein